MHWQRWRRHGDPLTVLPPNPGPQIPAEQRFWAKVDRLTTPDGCWTWTKARDRDGYGAFKDAGRMWRASRWIFVHTVGPLADAEMVRHTCDNPPCVRPDHLIRGTVVDNSADQVERGRTARGGRHGAHVKPESRRRGEANGAARLTETDVIDIRRRYSAGETQQALAAQFGVSQPLVSQIVRRTVWTHLE